MMDSRPGRSRLLFTRQDGMKILLGSVLRCFEKHDRQTKLWNTIFFLENMTTTLGLGSTFITWNNSWKSWNDWLENIKHFEKEMIYLQMVVFADDVFTAPWNWHVFTTHVECYATGVVWVVVGWGGGDDNVPCIGTHVQSATEWTASVQTLHMPKHVM